MPVTQDKWIVYHKKMVIRSRSFANFTREISNQNTLIDYIYWMNQYMKFCTSQKHIQSSDDFEELLKFDGEKITDIFLDFIDFLIEKGNKGVTIRLKITAPSIFFEMNRKIFHKKLVQKSIPKDNVEKGGKLAINENDLQNMLECADTLRQKAILHFLSSTGIRPQGLTDPVLRMKHLVSMPHPEQQNIDDYCYGVKIYDESLDGYWVFLTPEARKALDRYISARRNNGETITDESPIFATEKRYRKIHDHIKVNGVYAVINGLIRKSGMKRTKTGKRYDKAITYMFRKRFNSILKISDTVNSNIAEKLMSHSVKTIQLDNAYLDVGRDIIYKEFCKAIPDLTISKEEKQRHELARLSYEKSELEKKNLELQEMKDDVEKIKQRLEISEKFQAHQYP